MALPDSDEPFDLAEGSAMFETSEGVRRASMLLMIRRPAEALRELTEVLSAEPENAQAHGLMASVLVELGRRQQALESARRVVFLVPDLAWAHLVLGRVSFALGQYDEAHASARTALELDPCDPDAHAFLASCWTAVGDLGEEVLAAADRGLAFDPEHSDCLRMRAQALRMLGRAEEESETLELALRGATDDAYLHTWIGDSLLRKGDTHGALERFREALRLDPRLGAARRGLLLTLKARSPLFRPFLRLLTMALGCSQRTMVIATSLFFALPLIANLERATVGPQSLGGFAAALFLSAVWMYWVRIPLTDIVLWLPKDTRDLLEPRERQAAVAVGATVLAAPFAAALLAIVDSVDEGLLAGALLLAVAAPIAGAMSLQAFKARFAGCTAAFGTLALTIAGTLHSSFASPESAFLSVDENPAERVSLLLALALMGCMLSFLYVWLLRERAARLNPSPS